MLNMKGLELPINILVIVVIAVIVLIAVIAMFYPSFSSGGQTVVVENVKSQACQVLVEAKNCGKTTPATNTYDIWVNNFDANKDNANLAGTEIAYPAACLPAGGNDNLARLCICYYSITTEPDCKALCGC